VPQELQYFAVGSSSDAHPGHAFMSDSDALARLFRSCPHAPQAGDPGATAAPQDGQ
jgi:hypothetical protein